MWDQTEKCGLHPALLRWLMQSVSAWLLRSWLASEPANTLNRQQLWDVTTESGACHWSKAVAARLVCAVMMIKGP